jgi:Polyketide cyclase / dehydrase and lipid transport
MVRVTVERTVRCAPEEFLALVMDAERYAEVDAKLGRIDWVRREGDVVDFRFRSQLPGVVGPTPKVVSRMRLTPGKRVDVEYAPPPWNRLLRRVSTFAASFVCEQATGGTRVIRTIEFGFAPFLRWFVEPILRRTLRPDVEREVQGAKDLLERSP